VKKEGRQIKNLKKSKNVFLTLSLSIGKNIIRYHKRDQQSEGGGEEQGF